MKGLLHRLAARAAGTTVPVRSDARLPIGSANLRWGESFDIEAAAEPAGMAAAEHHVRAPVEAPSSEQPDGSEPAGAVPRPDPHPSPARQTESRPPTSHDHWADQPSASRAASPSPEAQPEPHPSPARRTESRPVTSLEVWADQPSASRAASPSPEAQPDPELPPALLESGTSEARQDMSGSSKPSQVPVPGRPTTEAPPPSLRSDLSLQGNDEPSLLMPREAGTHAPPPAAGVSAEHHSARPDVAAQAPPPPPPLMPEGANEGVPTASDVSALAHQLAWPASSAGGTENEPTEVHIHIGRIEVTAVHEASPQRPKPKARQAAMSLESYLAGRNKP